MAEDQKIMTPYSLIYSVSGDRKSADMDNEITFDFDRSRTNDDSSLSPRQHHQSR